MDIGLLLSYLSLLLSVFFWWNARQQANDASRTLNDIKTQIIGWQNELNKTAIEMLSSRPEMVAKQTMLASANSEAAFSASIAATIAKLTESLPDPASASHVEAVLDRLLRHQEAIVIGKQSVGFAAAAGGLKK